MRFLNPRTDLLGGEHAFFEEVLSEYQRMEERDKKWSAWMTTAAVAAAALYFGGKAVKVLRR